MCICKAPPALLMRFVRRVWAPCRFPRALVDVSCILFLFLFSSLVSLTFVLFNPNNRRLAAFRRPRRTHEIRAACQPAHIAILHAYVRRRGSVATIFAVLFLLPSSSNRRLRVQQLENLVFDQLQQVDGNLKVARQVEDVGVAGRRGQWEISGISARAMRSVGV
ncbi:hypothetical protein IWX91DRAFT_330843 [Phyllosticta citricarpa]